MSNASRWATEPRDKLPTQQFITATLIDTAVLCLVAGSHYEERSYTHAASVNNNTSRATSVTVR